MKPKIAFACASNFMRGAMTIGGHICCYNHGIDPVMMTGCSAGALAAISTAEWNRAAMDLAFDSWRNLTPSLISRYRFGDKVFLASVLAGALFHFAPQKRNSFWTHAARAGLTLGLPALALKIVLSQSSVCTSDPLKELLKANINFEKISRLERKIAIVSADHETGERIVHTNFLEKDRGDGVLLEAALTSSAIPFVFKPRMINGRLGTDGIRARQDPLAMDLIEEYANPDKILVFLFYWLPREDYRPDLLSIHDHDNELIVRDKLEATLATLPPETKKKIVLVLAKNPPKKIGLHNFTKSDVETLIEDGYRATEESLKAAGLI